MNGENEIMKRLDEIERQAKAIKKELLNISVMLQSLNGIAQNTYKAVSTDA